jgi:AGZA family xanthine/uracil permease-like MFS transporter
MREKLFDGIPAAVRGAIPVGIGLFIAFIGMQNSHIVVPDPYVLVSLAKFNSLWGSEGTPEEQANAKQAILCILCLVVIATLSHINCPGAVVIGILFGTIIGIPMKITDTKIIAGNGGVSWAFWKNFDNYFKWDSSKGGLFMSCFRGFNFPQGSAGTVIVLIISLGMIDLFDTMGTVVGCSTKAELNDEEGKPEAYGPIMYSDSIASLCAGMLGTSSVTTYVESGSGIAAGGRTGLVALTVSILFLLAIFVLPIFAFIPPAAAGSALIWVGVLMMTTVKEIDFGDTRDAVAAFFTIAMMPLTYSITNGIGLGMLIYVVIYLISWIIELIRYAGSDEAEKKRPTFPISVVTIVIAVLFLVNYFVPTKF